MSRRAGLPFLHVERPHPITYYACMHVEHAAGMNGAMTSERGGTE